MSGFTHIRDSLPAMVDIGGKGDSARRARAEAWVRLPPEVLALFDGTDLRGPKGAVFQAAILAGIMAAKRTWELIPLCHAEPLDDCKIEIRLEGGAARIECRSATVHRTGVEMEALTGASVAALTLYDMCKAVSPEMEIGPVRLLEKTGGKRDYRRAG